MWSNPRVMNALALGLSLVAVIALVAAAVVAAARSPRFNIQRITVVTPIKKVDRAYVERVVRKEFAGTYFTLNLTQAQTAIARLPWVRSVSVRRVWPRALEIHIVEHDAFARWNAEGLVSAEGVAFAGRTDELLPQLSGPEGTERSVVERFTKAQAALRSLGLNVRVMTLSPSHSLSAELDQGASVHFGRDHFDARLTRLIEYGGKIKSTINVPIESFDLRYSRGIAVAMMNEPSPLSAKASTSSALRSARP